MERKKRIILNIALGLVAFLIICTFVSKSIYTMLLPKVEIQKTQSGKLTSKITVNGEFIYKDTLEFKALSQIKITDVFVKKGR